MYVISSILYPLDTFTMRRFITLLLCATLVSVGLAFPRETESDDRGYWSQGKDERYYFQHHKNYPFNIGCGEREFDFGYSAFYFLHKMAENYFDYPSPQQQDSMTEMIRIFLEFFPHPYYFLQQSVMANPPDASNRESLTQWVCSMHNDVSTAMGKPAYDCSTVRDVWRNECGPNSRDGCDPDNNFLGRATFNLLHTYAYTYSENPSPRQQEDMRKFMFYIAEFFPSPSYYFITSLSNDEPDTSNRESFMNWMCRNHNYVNARRGKPEFDCSEVEEHWRYNGCENYIYA